MFDSATGSLAAKTDAGLTYNAGTGMLTATGFTGPLTGNVTGNASGTAATVTGAAQSAITSLGTLTTLTVDNVIINGTTIGHTTDTDLMTLADGALTIAGTIAASTASTIGNLTLANGSITDSGGSISFGNENLTTTGTLASGAFTVGSDGNGADVIFYSGTNGDNFTWDASEEQLIITGTNGTTALNVADGNVAIADDLAVDGTSNLDDTDIDGTLAVDGTTISLDATTSLNIDNSNTSNGVTIATATSGVPISIGHGTSETTVNDNLTVTGNLTVSGTTTTVSSSTLTIGDSLIKLGQAYTGSAYDQGIIFTRGDGSNSNTANRAMLWDESADVFVFANTNTEAGTTSGNVTLNDYANVRLGALTADDASTFTTSIKTPLIEYTDGDDAMTIADGGKVTFAAGFAVGSDAAGDMLYHNGTSYVRLAKGTADQVLTMNDGATAPGWETAASSGATLTGSTDNTIVTVTGSNAIAGEANFTFDTASLLTTKSAGSSISGLNSHLNIQDTTTEAGGTGPVILFSGWTNGTSNAEPFAAIGGYKDNSTNDNDSGFMGFYTRTNGSNLSTTERMRISSTGNVGIGPKGASNPAWLLDVTSDGGESGNTTGNDPSMVMFLTPVSYTHLTLPTNREV